MGLIFPGRIGRILLHPMSVLGRNQLCLKAVSLLLRLRFPNHPLSLRVLLVTLLCLGTFLRFSRYLPELLSLQSPKRSQTEPQLSLQSPEISQAEP